MVASEVRELARRTQIAAQSISKLTASGVGIVQKAGKTLESLVPDIQKTAELVQEISAASKEQSAGARQINMAIVQLDQVTQQHSAASEEMAATAEQLAAQAEQLQQTMAFFQTEQKESEKSKLLSISEEDASENIHKGDVPDRPEKGSGRITLDIADVEATRDDLDDEFEHY